MSELSDGLSASARNSAQRVLQALSVTNNKQVAATVNIDASTLSRMKSDKKNNGLNEIEIFAAIVDSLGLKIVPIDFESMDRDTAGAMLHLTKCYINRFESVDDLFHEEISRNKQALGY